jgi:hypothetical protein
MFLCRGYTFTANLLLQLRELVETTASSLARKVIGHSLTDLTDLKQPIFSSFLINVLTCYQVSTSNHNTSEHGGSKPSLSI